MSVHTDFERLAKKLQNLGIAFSSEFVRGKMEDYFVVQLNGYDTESFALNLTGVERAECYINGIELGMMYSGGARL